jgi:hypothetical protein
VVRRNLGRVNEEAIDFDLLEHLVAHIDDTQPPGAILVFLPGACDVRCVMGHTVMLCVRRQGAGTGLLHRSDSFVHAGSTDGQRDAQPLSAYYLEPCMATDL